MFPGKSASLVNLALFCIALGSNLYAPLLATEAIHGQMGVVAQYRPPRGLGAPPTKGGGTRGGRCEQDSNIQPPFLTAIKPDEALEYGWGQTVSERPQFFVYLPPTAAESAEFVLKDERENDIARTNLAINGKTGIVGWSLPSNSPKLEVGKQYHWYFSVICNPNNRRKDVSVDGWTKRVEMSATLAAKLQNAAERDRSTLYAENEIWYEAVASLVAEYQKHPNDAELATAWQKLLESGKVNGISKVPFNFTQLEVQQ